MNDNTVIAKQLVNEYLSKINDNNALQLIYLYSNFTCNEGCKYCWIDETNTNHNFVLSQKTVDSFIYEAISLGVSQIKISGGEPFLNKEVPDIIGFLLDCGLSVEVETNGTLLSESMMDKIASKPDKIHFKISLDSSFPDIQNEITRYSSAFEDTINGINVLKKYGIQFDIITVVNKMNFNHIEELIQFVESLEAKHHRIILNLQPIGH